MEEDNGKLFLYCSSESYINEFMKSQEELDLKKNLLGSHLENQCGNAFVFQSQFDDSLHGSCSINCVEEGL